MARGLPTLWTGSRRTLHRIATRTGALTKLDGLTLGFARCSKTVPTSGPSSTRGRGFARKGHACMRRSVAVRVTLESVYNLSWPGSFDESAG